MRYIYSLSCWLCSTSNVNLRNNHFPQDIQQKAAHVWLNEKKCISKMTRLQLHRLYVVHLWFYAQLLKIYATARTSARLLRLSVCGTSNKEISGTNPQSTGSLSIERVLSMFFSMCRRATDVWYRSSFQVTTCTFFSADVGKTIDPVLTTHPLQTVIKLSFVANGSESFCVHCSACWTSPEVILFSGSLHLLQDPGYRVWSLASHTKHSVSASTRYWRLFLPVPGKHLPVKNGICTADNAVSFLP